MVWALMMGVALSTQPPVPARSIEYVPISAQPQVELMRAIERALPDLAPRGVGVRRSPLNKAAMEACLTPTEVGDRGNPCIRALLPGARRNSSVIALRVTVATVCNITGRRCHYRHQLHCIGPRSIGTAALGDDETPAGAFRRERGAEITVCLTTAMTPRNAEKLSRDPRTGAPLWRLGLNSYIPDNPALSRGQASEQAIVDVQQVRRRPGAGGRCLVRVRVRQVEGYYFLRQGDLVEVAAPCTGEARARFDRAVAAPIRPRGRARIYVGYDGDLMFLEPL